MEQLTLHKDLTARQAINEVIRNNKKYKYNPQRFIQMMNVQDQDKLLLKIEQLIQNTDESVLGTLFIQVKEKKTILTIEDLVVLFGEKWGYSDSLLNIANERVKKFNEWANGERFLIELI
ncbi:hypothetical protein [Mesobacillus subterraneus]|uniref:Uncharacterized protein n=1 Tax=Mesobacillus subterraneus TaxID=285983 RepID=A0A427TDI9_9BACI|nr:hypothetical protein [Mesobacillus subterraneus]RSD20624.1 hypothetical protein EJA10_22985 [Mesobacillus subterraneus]